MATASTLYVYIRNDGNAELAYVAVGIHSIPSYPNTNLAADTALILLL